jgi:Protein of unknown function (DUF4089)
VDAEVDGHDPTIGILFVLSPYCAGHIARGGQAVAEKPDIGRLVDEAARAIGLEIAPEYRDNVILNVERSLAIAQPLLDIDLDDELTSAPVFRP